VGLPQKENMKKSHETSVQKVRCLYIYHNGFRDYLNDTFELPGFVQRRP